MSVTKLENMIDPEVMGAMIQAELPQALKFTGIAQLDTTLQGRPGDEITVPSYKYIGDAVDVAEGTAIDYNLLETTTRKIGIKKAAKGVELTDESVLSGYGDPVGEAQRQVRMALASKIDNDVLAAALESPLTLADADIDMDLIDKIEATFVDAPDAIEGQTTDQMGTLFLSYKDAAKLRKAAADNWTRASQLGDNILVSGAFGELLGWEIVRSKKVEDGQFVAVKPGALKIYLKRELLAESARDIDHKQTKFNADQHYGVAIDNDALIVRSADAPSKSEGE
ncbi:N4-gp56 family major capsid protein [Weissella thailandensis]|uniref:N4-gp56 family major capsid protein n=1 Tax=Weissella thailandensis TaxID=89061 RepID=A0ABX9I4J9_9LACO|nr:N4-gp56 family major capsid protein [Weissella thailandensis]NKY90859.1 N4-gp56 family major capsid protein [Weissella thailandensis]RDS59638.1 N4-gp56 family major capsid protein [Weissella thailandensis]GEP75468.1 putative major head protein, phage associated [Weissella thailandensis]